MNVKNALYFSNRGFVFLWLSICYFTSNNRALALNFLQRSRLCFHVVKQLIENESLIGDVQIDEALHHLFHSCFVLVLTWLSSYIVSFNSTPDRIHPCSLRLASKNGRAGINDR